MVNIKYKMEISHRESQVWIWAKFLSWLRYKKYKIITYLAGISNLKFKLEEELFSTKTWEINRLQSSMQKKTPAFINNYYLIK